MKLLNVKEKMGPQEIPQFRGGEEKACVLPHDMLSMGHGRTDQISGENLYLKRDQ